MFAHWINRKLRTEDPEDPDPPEDPSLHRKPKFAAPVDPERHIFLQSPMFWPTRSNGLPYCTLRHNLVLAWMVLGL